MSGPRRNIELKARCGDLEAAAEAARLLGATFGGELRQVDTYFHAKTGRLKLREIAGGKAELIWYAREDSVELRGSDYYILPIGDADLTRTVLSRALGIRGEVRKVRRLWLWQNVRIHLDEVEGLGTFVEFEAVRERDDDEAACHERLTTLVQKLNIKDEDRLSCSYVDLL